MTHSHKTHLSPPTRTLIEKGNKYQIGDVVQNGEGQLGTIVLIYLQHKLQKGTKRRGWITQDHPCANDPDWIFDGSYLVSIELGECREVFEDEIFTLVKTAAEAGAVGFVQ